MDFFKINKSEVKLLIHRPLSAETTEIKGTLEQHYKAEMTKIELSKNYRFKNNPDMLKLDKNIRVNAASCFTPIIEADDIAKLPAFWGATQQDEAEQVVDKVKNLLAEDNVKIAILFRNRSKNAEIVESELAKNGIQYFYGMFTDEDLDYVEFHNKCQEMFISRFGK